MWELVRRACLRDSFTFTRFIFGHTSHSEAHREWHAIWNDPAQPKAVTAAPAGHGKTTQILGWLLWKIGHNPSLHACICCETIDPAIDRVTGLANLIDGDTPASRRLRWIFPHLQRDNRKGVRSPWNADAITVLRPDGSDIHPTVSAASLASGNVAGARLDVLIADNIMGEKTAISKAGRKSAERLWFNVFETRPVAGALIRVADYFWNPKDLASNLHRHGYRVHTWRGDPERGLLPGDTDKGIRLLEWTEVWPQERYDKLREEIPPREYDRNYRLIPSHESERWFNADKVKASMQTHYPFWEERNGHPPDSVFYMGVDLSTGTEEGDDTAITLAELGGDGHRWLRHLRGGRWGQMEILYNIVWVQWKFRPMFCFVENEGQQKYIIDGLTDHDVLVLICQRLGMSERELTDILTHMQVVPTKTGRTGKLGDDGIKAMGLLFEAGKVHVPEHPLGRRFVDECITWTPDGHTGDVLSSVFQIERGLQWLRG